ncbi:hypothetical protein F4810DRAFT_671215 [Camillea tinctor]|nr:hypothetical protein F4810DRAFT_671215 [Camillea tinctor]
MKRLKKAFSKTGLRSMGRSSEPVSEPELVCEPEPESQSSNSISLNEIIPTYPEPQPQPQPKQEPIVHNFKYKLNANPSSPTLGYVEINNITISQNQSITTRMNPQESPAVGQNERSETSTGSTAFQLTNMPQVSPMEYARTYYLDEAKAALEGRAVRIPKPVLHHHHDKGNNAFSIVPEIPNEARAHLPQPVSSDKREPALPTREPLNESGQSSAKLVSKAKSAQDLRESSAKTMNSLFSDGPQSQGSTSFRINSDIHTPLRSMTSDQVLNRTAENNKEAKPNSSARRTPRYKVMPTIAQPPTIPPPAIPLPAIPPPTRPPPTRPPPTKQRTTFPTLTFPPPYMPPPQIPQNKSTKPKNSSTKDDKPVQNLKRIRDTFKGLQKRKPGNEEEQSTQTGQGLVGRDEGGLSTQLRKTSEESTLTLPVSENSSRDDWSTRKDRPLPPLPVGPYGSQASGPTPELRRKGNFVSSRGATSTSHEQDWNLSPTPQPHIAHMGTLGQGTNRPHDNSVNTYRLSEEASTSVESTRVPIRNNKGTPQLVTADAETFKEPREPSGFPSSSSAFLPQHNTPPHHQPSSSHLENSSTGELTSQLLTTADSATAEGKHNKYSKPPPAAACPADLPVANISSTTSFPNQSSILIKGPPTSREPERATKGAEPVVTWRGHPGRYNWATNFELYTRERRYHKPNRRRSTQRVHFAKRPIRRVSGGPKLVIYDPDSLARNLYPHLDSQAVDLAHSLLPSSPADEKECFRLVSDRPPRSRYDALVLSDFSLPPGRESVPSLTSDESRPQSSSSGSDGPAHMPDSFEYPCAPPPTPADRKQKTHARTRLPGQRAPAYAPVVDGSFPIRTVASRAKAARIVEREAAKRTARAVRRAADRRAQRLGQWYEPSGTVNPGKLAGEGSRSRSSTRSS